MTSPLSVIIFCRRVNTQHAISAAVKQTGTSVIAACGLAEHSNGKAACLHLCLCVSKDHLSSSPCTRVCLSLCVCVFRERFSVHARLCLSATVCSKASSRETKRGHINTQLDWADVVWWECYGGHPLLQQRWISHLYKAFCRHTLTLTLTICWMTYDHKPTSGIKTDVRLHCTLRHYTLRYWLKTNNKSRRCIFFIQLWSFECFRRFLWWRIWNSGMSVKASKDNIISTETGRARMWILFRLFLSRVSECAARKQESDCWMKSVCVYVRATLWGRGLCLAGTPHIKQSGCVLLL